MIKLFVNIFVDESVVMLAVKESLVNMLSVDESLLKMVVVN